MQYRKDRYGNQISILGYGCMRFTKSGGRIDLKKAETELMFAIENGVNYFDTAYIYGGSEAALGEILSRNNVRGKIHLATKLPHYLIRNMEGIEKTFNEQLKRLKTDYIDFYLFHMLNDIVTWEKLVKAGIIDFLNDKIKAGKIRQIGFSYHGNSESFTRLLDAYDWDFCQIQYNYLDENSQAGIRGLKYAHEKGLPVIVMCPLRGGRLVDQLPDKAKALIQNDAKQRTATELAFKWLWNQPEVTCVLSGMNSLKMVSENINIAESSKALSFDDYDDHLIDDIRREIMHKTKVACTGCGYCMPCPKGVDIPLAFYCYNMLYSSKKGIKMEYMQSTAMRKEQSSISNCNGCKKCEKVCPQAIPICAELKNASKKLETFSYRLIKWAVKSFRLF
ncbi:MAG: aldo/keto reductase [Lachnospiraceae bacterium]|nr:aldo/keto reductase [Lachnospiraceae bacterium]